MTIRPASDRSVHIGFASENQEDSRLAVLRAMQALARLPGAVQLHPAYASILVEFDPRRTAMGVMENAIAERLSRPVEIMLPEPRVVEIPVCYNGPDLNEVARLTGMSVEDVVRLHTSSDYTVCFLGFSPGFPYLSGLSPYLAVPRLPSPRKKVPAGSVAIGGSHTGVYPVASPGGWRIIGRTELALFRPAEEPPVLLRMGDRVLFTAVAEERS